MEFFNERILIEVRDFMGTRLAAGASDVASAVLIAYHGDGARGCAYWNFEQTVHDRAIDCEIDGHDAIGGGRQKAGPSDPAFCRLTEEERRLYREEYGFAMFTLLVH